ncbi:MAG: hypothetical protein Q4G43_13965 [Mobilicoccus sp.]|nr:hypothetical protein [Mobilicoccus sp.]
MSTDLDPTLRRLDAAPTHLTDDQRARKAALLATLTSDDTVSLDDVRGRRDRRRGTRWVLPAAAAAALVGGIVIWGGPGGGEAAYASWTAQPEPVDADTLASAEHMCRDSAAESHGRLDDGSSTSPTASPEDFRTVAAERRGDFGFLAMAADDGSTRQCFFDTARPGRFEGATGGLATRDSPPLAPLAPEEIEDNGAGYSGGPEGGYRFITARVGSDVTGVRVHADAASVEATVSNGWMVAWWPDRAEVSPWDRGPELTYDVTLRDGTTLEGVTVGQEKAPLNPRQIGDLGSGGGVSEDGSQVSMISGRAGAEVASVTITVNGTAHTVPVEDGYFQLEYDGATDEDPTFDLVLIDSTVLADQTPVE